MINNLLTTTQLIKRAKSEGIIISKYALMRWIKENAFPTIKSGNRVYIFWGAFVKFITGGQEK